MFVGLRLHLRPSYKYGETGLLLCFSDTSQRAIRRVNSYL